MVYGKTVCKGLFSDGIYICGMHLNWSVVSETEFYGYEYCNHIYSGGFDYFDCDRWLSAALLVSKNLLCPLFLRKKAFPLIKFHLLLHMLSTQLAFRTQILFDTDRLLQNAKGETEILDVTCTQLLRLLNRSITAYVVENKIKIHLKKSLQHCKDSHLSQSK